MSNHQFERCAFPQLISTAKKNSPHSHLNQRTDGSPATTDRRQSRGPDTDNWTLELQRGANEVLAHLHGSPDRGPLRYLPRRLGPLTLQHKTL